MSSAIVLSSRPRNRRPVASYGQGLSFRVQRSEQRLRKIRQIARVAEAQGDLQTADLARSILRLQQLKARGPQLPFFL